MSYGHQLLKDQYVCYANSMEQYACRGWRGQYGFECVQKLVLGSSLTDKSHCDHVDRANNKPVIESMLVS